MVINILTMKFHNIFAADININYIKMNTIVVGLFYRKLMQAAYL